MWEGTLGLQVKNNKGICQTTELPVTESKERGDSETEPVHDTRNHKAKGRTLVCDLLKHGSEMLATKGTSDLPLTNASGLFLSKSFPFFP